MNYSIIDLHADTVSHALDSGKGLFQNGLNIDVGKLSDYTQVFAAFIAPEYYNTAMERAMAIINKLKSEIAKYPEKIAFCKSYDDYIKNSDKFRAFLSLEGGEPISTPDDLQKLYNEGVRIMTLTWNNKNALAAGVMEEDETEGLTPFGREIVKKAEELGIILDVSHLNDKSFWDLAEITQKPIIASHSNSRAECSHKRNLTDEQFLEIKRLNGIVGINIYPKFLSDSNKAGISDIIRHIEHFMSLGGEDNVGMGSDFDGVQNLPDKISGAEDIYRLFDELLRLNYPEKLINKISYTNIERFLQENL